MTYRDAEEVYMLAKYADGNMPLKVAAERLGYGSSRGVARRISAAYHYFEESGNDYKCRTIAETFVDRFGNYAFDYYSTSGGENCDEVGECGENDGGIEEMDDGEEETNVWFRPFVGLNYGDYMGRRILVIGNSHYCKYRNKCRSCGIDGGCFDRNEGCGDFSTEAIVGGWSRAHCNFAYALAGSTEVDCLDVWNDVAFYNYLQTAVASGSDDGDDDDYEESSMAFWEVINELKPDGIIVWGNRAWNAMPAFNGDGWYELDDGKVVPAIKVTHPSAWYGRFDYANVHKKICAFVKTLPSL